MCVAGVAGVARVASAQDGDTPKATKAAQSTAADSALYVKAQQMVSNGEAAAGRALIDSLIGAAQPRTPRYAEALYWRAALAGSAADAERSYRQIVVDYPLSPRVDNALLRMGQLELTRGDREAALQHFQRLTLEHPGSPLRAKASYWTARAYLEKNDLKHACAANADALSHALASDVELRNQIDYQNQRCAGVAVPTAVAQNAGASDASAAGQAVPAESGTVASATESAADADVPVAPAPKPVKGKANAKTAKSSKGTPSKSKPAAAPAETRSDDAAPSESASANKKSGKFTVQVAAYYDRVQAEALATKLRGRGYPVHVDGGKAPFRVRIGHYETHAQAANALANLKAKKITGFVTQE
jgi:cell division septation protein DedD/TolA-binding protein